MGGPYFGSRYVPGTEFSVGSLLHAGVLGGGGILLQVRKLRPRGGG